MLPAQHAVNLKNTIMVGLPTGNLRLSIARSHISPDAHYTVVRDCITIITVVACELKYICL